MCFYIVLGAFVFVQNDGESRAVTTVVAQDCFAGEANVSYFITEY